MTIEDYFCISEEVAIRIITTDELDILRQQLERDLVAIRDEVAR